MFLHDTRYFINLLEGCQMAITDDDNILLLLHSGKQPTIHAEEAVSDHKSSMAWWARQQELL